MKSSVVVMAIIAITWTTTDSLADQKKRTYADSKARSAQKSSAPKRSLSQIFGLKKSKSTAPPTGSSETGTKARRVAMPFTRKSKTSTTRTNKRNNTGFLAKVRTAFTPQPPTKSINGSRHVVQKPADKIVLAAGQQEKRPVVQQLNSMFKRDGRQAPSMHKLPNTQLKHGQVVRAKQPVKKTGLLTRLFGSRNKTRKPAKLPDLYNHKDPGPPRGAARTTNRYATQQRTVTSPVSLTPVPEQDICRQATQATTS